MSLAEKVIVITGASSGAGRAAALEFARHQSSLVLAARSKWALEEVAEDCRRSGAEVKIIPADVSDSDAVKKLATEAWEWKDRIDVWINNAGVLAAGPFEQTPIEIHQQVIQTNLMGYIHGAHSVLPYFKQQGHGILINNISIGAFLPVPYGTAYSASKFALRGFSQALKGELGEWPDIYVCDLYPAFLHTPGILHAANYTGKEIKAAPPVYDPFKVARTMIETVLHPRPESYIGSVARLFKLSHSILPEPTTAITGKFMRAYFGQADATSPTPGNVLNPVDYAMQPFGPPQEERATRKLNIAASIAIAAGISALAFSVLKRTVK